jgi:fermentation-respiration switch protein FrsA (DUF1100 family)
VRALSALLGFFAVAYGALLLLVYTRQGRLLYLPTQVLDATPGDIGLDHEELCFTTADQVRLHGWWIPAPNARHTLLFMHGNAGNIAGRLPSLRLFHDLGLSVLIFDYRGYGRSAGAPDEQGTYRDARAAWDALVARGIPPERIVLFGRSLGGAIAANLAADVAAAALIVESSFTSAADLAAALYPWLPARALLRFRYDTRARLRERSCPLLVVHSDEDELIPYSHAMELYEAASPPKSLLTMHGRHADGFLTSGELYRTGLAAFLAALP